MTEIDYIKANFTQDVKKEERTPSWRFPSFLEKLYSFAKCTINGLTFTIMQDLGKDNLTAGTVMTHGERVQEETGFPVIYVTKSLPSDGRKRMCVHHFGFIVPGVELYLPQLYVQLKENQPAKTREFSSLGVAAQYLTICYLNGFIAKELSISDAMVNTGYSRMGVIQAFTELEYFKAGSRMGKHRHFVFMEDKRELWEEIRGVLRNPCKRTIGLEKLPEGCAVVPAGTAALCKRSMLSDKEPQEYAMRLREFNALGKVRTVHTSYASVLLQLWTYPPLPGNDGIVEPFSLFLTLADSNDDRIQISLEEMMRSVVK
ncbi:MAG: hypothetical protein IJT83_00525 [Victivallales bacterium]|nr:hypothetical protein [Victivallales bacterium]